MPLEAFFELSFLSLFFINFNFQKVFFLRTVFDFLQFLTYLTHFSISLKNVLYLRYWLHCNISFDFPTDSNPYLLNFLDHVLVNILTS